MDDGGQVVYNVFHEAPLGVPIAIYFYMTGLSAGSFLISTMAYGLGMVKYKPVGKIGVVLAILLLVLAPINLIVDLGQPLRFWHLLLYLQPTSPITYGSFLLTIYPLNCLIYGAFMFAGNAKLTRLFGLIGIPLALSVHGYTGFILALGKARALWNTALMPTYFLVSAMVSGIALMIIVVIIQGLVFSPEHKVNRELAFDFGRMLSITILLDLFLVGSDVILLLTADPEAREAAQMLLTGSFSPYFLGIEIFLGALIPVILLMLPFTKKRLVPVAIAAFLAMVGVMAMRYVLVIGGQALPLA
ncbi:MAG: NrfD/PsrC family molybdoenzyme membrane anchor subunit [Dehalococcoidia bacterium]|nr:NrfD/PsrC family molybdoenzyme membrane anchor subunit [Dehalococcoidia bacterium]